MNELNVKEIEAKNKFIVDFNLYASIFEMKLNKLGLSSLKNLAVVLRNVVYNLEDKFSVYKENSFFSSISSQVIITLFEEVLKMEIDELDTAYDKLYNSLLLSFIHTIIPMKRLVDYQFLCLQLEKFSVSTFIDPIIDTFYIYAQNQGLTKDETDNLFVELNNELNILNNEQTSYVVENGTIKSIGTIK